MGLDAVKDAASKFEKWDPLKPAAKPAAAPAAPNVALGPNTQALAEKAAERKALAAEAADKLRAGTAAAPAVAAAPPQEPQA
jgi:sec-independent protein translocase protein TatB